MIPDKSEGPQPFEARSAEAGRTLGLRLAAVVLAALAIRGIFLWLRSDYLDWDEAMYLLIARSYLEGQGPSLNGLPHTALGPFLPLATAAISWVTGAELLVAQRALSAVAGAALVLPVWYLIRRHSGAEVALTAAWLLIAWPALVDVSPRLGPIWQHMYAGTEPTYLLLLFASVASGEAALAKRGAGGMALSIGAGALLALAYLARAEAVVFAGIYVIVRGALWIRDRGEKRLLLVPAIAGLAFLLVAAPHLLRLREIHGSWSISGQPAVMRPAAETLQESFRSDSYLPNFVRTWWRLDAEHTHLLNPYWGTPEGVEPQVQAAQFARLAALEAPIQRSLWVRVGNRLSNYGYMLWTLSGVLLLPFMLVGVIASRRSGLPVFAAVGFATSLVVGLYLAVLPRFFLYLVPIFALWAAHGVHRVAALFGPRRVGVKRVLIAGLVGVALVVVGTRARGELARRLSLVAYEDRKAGENLAAALPSDGLVMHWHPRFAYWAGWDWRTMPMAGLDGMVHYATRIGVRHILLARGGYSPLNADVPHLLLVLQPELSEAFGTTATASERGHSHPQLQLTPVDPVGGIPTGVLSLKPEPSERRD